MNLIEAMNEAFKGKIIQTMFANTLAYRMNSRGELEAFYLNGKPIVEPHNCNILSKDEINAEWRIVEEKKRELSLQIMRDFLYKIKNSFATFEYHLNDVHSAQTCSSTKEHMGNLKRSLSDLNHYLSEIEKK